MKGKLAKTEYVDYEFRKSIPKDTEIRFDLSNEDEFIKNFPMVKVVLNNGKEFKVPGKSIIATEPETSDDYDFLIKLNAALSKRKKLFALYSPYDSSVLFNGEDRQRPNLIFDLSSTHCEFNTTSAFSRERIKRSIFQDILFNMAREEDLEVFKIIDDPMRQCCYIKRCTKGKKDKVVGKYKDLFEAINHAK